ncbi:MAG: aminopeptidase P family protein [Proteobacteria bacterium]|nr:aminopeptidase P family protein [Pseudomonadota bacterium]
MLAEERRRRLVGAMVEAGLEAMVVYGNAWQGDYLRYVSDFGILEGHGLAVVTADGACRLFLDSVVEVERAEGETAGLDIRLARDVASAVGGDLDRMANHRLAAAPRRFMPHWLTEAGRSFALEDGTALVDKLLLHKLPGEIADIRRAAQLADDGYGVFRAAAVTGRRQYELVADVEAFFRAKGCPDNFMIMGSGGVDVRGMAPPSPRRLAPGDLVTTELTPAVDGYYAQICRTLVVGRANDAQKRAFGVYLEAMEVGIAAVRPGVTAADVARAENDVFRRYGLGDYVTNKYTRVRGHGLGMFVDSKPHILEDVDVVLEAGMVIVVHPNTYHPEVGYMVLGDAVVVTATGADVLTRTPRELFEVPA